MYSAYDIKARIDLREVVASIWGTPKTSTRKYDKHYSKWRDDGRRGAFTVYPTYFRDYGGDGDTGSAIDFIMSEYGLDFKAALQWLADYAGLSIDTPHAKPAARWAPQTTRTHNTPPDERWQHAMRAFVDASHERLMNTAIQNSKNERQAIPNRLESRHCRGDVDA
jgi:hypothetical protein